MSHDLFIEQPQTTDPITQIRLLADTGNKPEDNVAHYRQSIRTYNADIAKQQLQLLNLWQPATPDLAALPAGAWFMQFSFTLAKPWLSKDDEPFYVSDGVNPVRKDKAFRVPMLAASSWKGVLRDAARRVHKWQDTQPEMVRLFGNPKGADDGFRAGRLMFYPTFFDKMGVEVINPHSRKTKVGKLPIYLECVPSGTQGVFSLLYVPFDWVGDAERARQESSADVQACAKAICALMLRYGFSAKRTAGFGAANDDIKNGFVQTGKNKTTLTKLSTLHTEATYAQL